MMLPEKLVKAVWHAECILTDTPSPCFPGLAGGRTHPECAVVAVLRALPENVVPAVWAHRMPSGNFHRFHGKDSVHMDGCIPLYDLGTIVKLADDD